MSTLLTQPSRLAGKSDQIRRCGLAVTDCRTTLGTNGGVDVISDTDLRPLQLTSNLISPPSFTEEAN